MDLFQEDTKLQKAENIYSTLKKLSITSNIQQRYVLFVTYKLHIVSMTI